MNRPKGLLADCLTFRGNYGKPTSVQTKRSNCWLVADRARHTGTSQGKSFVWAIAGVTAAEQASYLTQ